MTGDRSQLTNFVHKFLGTVKFGNDQVAKIMGYGDYQIGNVTISRVYYVEGLGHNLFSAGQFCDSDLEVAFRKRTLFNEFYSPPARVASPVPIEEALAPVESIGSPSSTSIDQDAPSQKTVSEESSSSDVISTTVHPDAPISEHLIKWTKDHLIQNIHGELYRLVSTRLQLHKQALFCYYDAFLTSVEPKTYKEALTHSCWIGAMQKELNEFERLKV
ncbi:hypothetical protein Tco_1327924 [Tanacetum coccineum]